MQGLKLRHWVPKTRTGCVQRAARGPAVKRVTYFGARVLGINVAVHDHVRDNGGLSRMEALFKDESITKVPKPDYPSGADLVPRSCQTQSVAAPVNSPIAQPVGSATVSTTHHKTPPKPREVFIQGITKQGRTFRPSDWAERLAGAMSSFRPGGGAMGMAAHIGYSPYCVPTSMGDVKCVVVNEALRDLEPMAWDFVMNFARDNDLQVVEACLLPDPPR